VLRLHTESEVRAPSGANPNDLRCIRVFSPGGWMFVQPWRTVLVTYLACSVSICLADNDSPSLRLCRIIIKMGDHVFSSLLRIL
jgi:hypothetical protein